MEQYINKSAVVAEIKKRLSLLEGGMGHPEVVKRVEGLIKGYKSILSFLDTLETKEELMLDLEDAAREYVRTAPHADIGLRPIPFNVNIKDLYNRVDIKRAFKAGAQWQKEHVDKETIKQTEDHTYFAGSENTREKLVDKACEWLANTDFCRYYNKEFIDNFRKAMEE